MDIKIYGPYDDTVWQYWRLPLFCLIAGQMHRLEGLNQCAFMGRELYFFPTYLESKEFLRLKQLELMSHVWLSSIEPTPQDINHVFPQLDKA